MNKLIDLRSDTVTKPSDEMRKAMFEAEVGDDVYQEDPTVNRLQSYAAELFGKEAALFVPSGVMGNQISLNVHTNPSDEIILEKTAHVFVYESGSAAGLSGLQLNLIEGNRGVFTPEQVEEAIRPASAYYMPRTKVIEIENTHNVAGGTIHPIENINAMRQLADKYGLAMHLDGARIWNAHVETGITLSEYASYFDSLSVCLSKGLGAPVGSLILGSDDFIEEAFRVRKAWGGGMRQVGIIAAGGLYAIQNNIPRLKEDHQKAKELARHLQSLGTVEVDMESVQTNILSFAPKLKTVEDGIRQCAENGLLVGKGGIGKIRAVTHLDVSFEEIDKAKNILTKIFAD
jgi:threonine aldolase